jgi:hypothetical protein
MPALATTLLVSCGGLTSLALGAGTADARPTGPYHWRPGDPMQYQTQPWLADYTGPGLGCSP